MKEVEQNSKVTKTWLTHPRVVSAKLFDTQPGPSLIFTILSSGPVKLKVTQSSGLNWAPSAGRDLRDQRDNPDEEKEPHPHADGECSY